MFGFVFWLSSFSSFFLLCLFLLLFVVDLPLSSVELQQCCGLGRVWCGGLALRALLGLLLEFLRLVQTHQIPGAAEPLLQIKRSFSGPQDPQSFLLTLLVDAVIANMMCSIPLAQGICCRSFTGVSWAICACPLCEQPSPELVFSQSPNADPLCPLFWPSVELWRAGSQWWDQWDRCLLLSEVLPQTNSTLVSCLGRWHLEVPRVVEGPCLSPARSLWVPVCPLLQGSSLTSVSLLQELLLGIAAACLGGCSHRTSIAREEGLSQKYYFCLKLP